MVDGRNRFAGHGCAGLGHGGSARFRRWGGGGRVFGPGDLRLVLLALIAKQPRHGYEVIKEREQRFGGSYSPSPGSVYPTLTPLEELWQIRATASEGAKRLFETTDEAKRWPDCKGDIDEARPAYSLLRDRGRLAR